MAGRSRVLGLGVERAFAPSAVACLVLGAGACIVQPEVPQDGTGGAGGFASSSSSGGVSFGSAGLGFGSQINLPIAVAGSPPVAMPCTPPPLEASAVFADQMFDNFNLARQEFFSWTTDEQAAELRRDQVLFTRSERPGMGPGYAFEIIQHFADDSSYPDRAQLAHLLGGELFAKARFAWSEAWPTRMGWPGEDYGGNLLRIVLKPEAWVAVVRNGDLTVLDLRNQQVPLTEVLADPARIGAIFFQKDGATGGPSCGGSFVSGSNGYREYILGNLAMVEEWSLGTQAIRDRLSESIERLSTFLQRMRACPVTSSAQQWNLSVVCNWQTDGPATSELDAYERSLAIPSENYLAVPGRIATMIETLQGDLFEPDPLVVTPGRP